MENREQPLDSVTESPGWRKGKKEEGSAWLCSGKRGQNYYFESNLALESWTTHLAEQHRSVLQEISTIWLNTPEFAQSLESQENRIQIKEDHNVETTSLRTAVC